jgi:cell division protein ZapA
MATSETITVSIFDKDYQVSCPADEVQALRDSAFYLDQKMREIKKSGSVLGLDRLAVMAALNITNDFLSVDREHQHARLSLVDHHEVLQHSEQRVDALIQTLKSSDL